MVRRIPMDNGLTVNIMPMSIMNDLGISIEELSKSRMIIKSFNLGGHRKMCMVLLDLTIGDLTTSSIFHMIDSMSS